MNATQIAQILGAKGQLVTIAGASSVVYDPATSTTTPTPYAKSANAVLLPLNPYRAANNSGIKAGDEQMLLAAVASDGSALPEPPLGAIVTLADGATKYTLVAVGPLHPSGDELIYDCIVRGH